MVLDQVFQVIDALKPAEGALKGIGAGAPGLIKEEAIVAFSPNIPFVDINLKDKIVKRYGCPFVLGNDVNVAMFGEWQYTGLTKVNSVIGLFVGTGIGGAIIIDGKLYLGMGSAGEMGHMVVNSDGALCGCGSNGCLEAYASKTAMQKFITAQIRKGREAMLEAAVSQGGVIKAKHLVQAYEEKDPVAVEVLEQAIRYLGIATANYVNIFHPEMFIFSGGIIEAFGRGMMEAIIEEAKRHAMPGLVSDVDFRMAQLGDDAGVFGAYSLIRSKSR